MAKSDEKKLEFYPTKPFSDDSLVPSVVFHHCERTFCLNRAIHSEQGAVYAFKIVQNFLVHRCQFFIQSDSSVFVGLFALSCIRTPRAVLAMKLSIKLDTFFSNKF